MKPTEAAHPCPVIAPKSSARDDPRVLRALEEYAAALKTGTRPDRQAFLAKYPEIAVALADCLDGLDFIQTAAPLLHQAVPDSPDTTLGELQPEGPLGDFRIVREIGRGGMGVVYEAVQISLGRRVALKVLPFAAALDGKQLQRFKNEAQAASHLHHQNIVPVYGVGCDRGVHHYSMQFIDGQTLSALIHELRHTAGPMAAPRGERTGPYTPGPEAPADESVTPPVAAISTERSTKKPAVFRTLARLGVQAAEALEHAHALGVIHRDIKPANLMVDLRGNLWITDFGLAHCQSQAGLTMTGDLVGTLRYMSPEQALAKRVLVDHRTDIYSLGATLYELLALEPPFAGSDRQELLRQIAFEEPRPLRRLNKAIPAELETIVQKAIEKNPNDRYASAQELADDLERFLKDEPIQAKRPTLLQRTRRWSRRHRPVMWAAAVCLLVAVVALAGSIGWIVGDREARRAATEPLVDDTLQEAIALLTQGKWADARAAARRAEGLLEGGGGREELRQRVRELQVDLAMLANLEEIRIRQTEVKDGQFDTPSADPGYMKAFREYGIDVEKLAVAEVANRIRARAIRVELAAAVDHWAMVCRAVREEHDLTWKHLLAVARAADPDPWRNQVREALVSRRPRELEKLAASDQLTFLAPSTLVLLANALAANGSLDKAGACLRAARQQYPADFWINHGLGWHLHRKRNPPQLDEAIRYYTAAVSLRPTSPGVHVNLSAALAARGSLDEAVAAYHEAIHHKRDYVEAHIGLASVLLKKGLPNQAIAAYREVIRLKPDYAEAYNGLGVVLKAKGELDSAIAAYHEAIHLNPNLVLAHSNLGFALREKGQLNAAIAACNEAIRLKPNLVEAHIGLANALHAKGELNAAVAALHKAIGLQPNRAASHCDLGVVLQKMGQLDAAITAFHKAIELDPNYALAYMNLGSALQAKRQLDAALAACRKAVDLEPNNAMAHHYLGVVLGENDHLDAAVAAFNEAIRLQPDFAEAYIMLGTGLIKLGRFSDALAAYRHGNKLGWKDPNNPLSARLKDCERLMALENKLPSILKGDIAPAGAAECIALAEMCGLKRLHGTRVQFYEKAFAAQVELRENTRFAHRYNAACSAALAGCGKGQDAAAPNDKERACLRRKALDWLRADLLARRQLLDKEPKQARTLVPNQMQDWQQDADFVGVRGPEALSRLPEAERLRWQQFWEEVEEHRKSIASLQ